MLSRKKPSARRRRARRIAAIVLIPALLITVYFEAFVRVQLTEVIRARMRSLMLRAADSAVAELIGSDSSIGERLTGLTFTDDGRVSALTTDPAYINLVKSEAASLTRGYIAELTRAQGVGVPLGSFTGLVFLSDLGPDVRLPVRCESSVSCALSSRFESAGINQTVHHISMTVTARAVVYEPFRVFDGITVSSDYEISQTVIIGAVPTYGGVVTY